MLGWSGIFAVIAANLVIAAYVIMAWNEDDDELRIEPSKQKQNLTHQIKKES